MGIPLNWEPPAGRKTANSKSEPAVCRRQRSNIRRITYARQLGTGRPNLTTVRYREPTSSSAREEPSTNRETNVRAPEDSLAGYLASHGRRAELRRRMQRDSTRYPLVGRRTQLGRDPIQRLLESAPLFDPSPSDWSQPSSASGSGRTPSRISFSARFAPAHPHESEIPLSATVALSNVRQNNEADAPLLQRSGYRSAVNTNDRGFHSIIDGLGDRARSFTPEDLNEDEDNEDDDEMHDAWETLLTTIQPDEQLPSASSSFASATATSGLTDSIDSALTAPSSFSSLMTGFHILPDQFTDLPPNCDESDGVDTEAELEEEDAHQRMQTGSNRHRRREEGETTQSSRRDATQQDTRSQPRDTEQSTLSTMASLADTLGPEFQQVHSILDRLSRRDDIPDEWWETAGLSRIIRRELNNSRSDGDSGA